MEQRRNLGGPGGTGLAAPAPAGFRHGMRSLRHRDFRLFMGGALVSNVGNWLQNLAVPFVLFELTDQALWVGLATFAQFIPTFVLGPLGGSLADRHDRRMILIITQSLMALAALALWLAWVAGTRSPVLILAITALTGVFSGLMIPSWQALVPALVDPDDLGSAITINSTQFNASRAIGPALAGLLLATVGPSWAFGLNVVSFLVVIVALIAIKTVPRERAVGEQGSVTAEFVEALRYIRTQPGIWLGMATTVLIAGLGNPITQFTVVFAERVYGASPRVVGLLAAAIGLGAIIAAPPLSAFQDRVSRANFVRYGLPFYGLTVIGFGLSQSWPVGLVLLLANGAGFLSVIATTNTSVQTIVADRMRGRVIAARVMTFTLAFPVGALLQGWLADVWGTGETVTAAGVVLFVSAVALAMRPALLDRLDDPPDPDGRL